MDYFRNIFGQVPNRRSISIRTKYLSFSVQYGIDIFFGDTKLDSGFFLAPDLPYFISFFLGKNEKPDKVYLGNYWQEGGRYLCIPCDGSSAKTYITEIDLSAKFYELFGKKPEPITALGIEVDVQKTLLANGRHSKAFIKRVELF